MVRVLIFNSFYMEKFIESYFRLEVVTHQTYLPHSANRTRMGDLMLGSLVSLCLVACCVVITQWCCYIVICCEF